MKIIEKKERISFRISSELREALEKASQDGNMTMTKYVTLLIAKDLIKRNYINQKNGVFFA